MMMRFQSLLLTLWIGGHWAIGYIAAPVLFKVIDDRALAGATAGTMFHIITIIGLLCAAALWMFLVAREKAGCFSNWRFWVLTLMFSLLAVSMFVLQPMIAEVKALGLEEGSDAAKRFGQLHGVSSIVYLFVSLFGALLVWAGLKRTTAKPRSALGAF